MEIPKSDKSDMENIEFGARLRELRKQAGLSQRELAAKVVINFTYLSKIESGVLPPPSEKVILKLAEVLKTDKDGLMTLAGKIPADIAQILKNEGTLQFLRARRQNMQEKRHSNKEEGFDMMKKLVNYRKLSRVALAIILVVAIGTSMWFASPIPTKAFSISAPVANSPVSGNTTYLLGEKIRIPAAIQFSAMESKSFQSVSLNITGPESFVKALPVAEGTYQYTTADNVSGILDVIVSWSSGVGAYGYGYGYGYATGSGNINYDIRWKPPYTLTTTPTQPPTALPGSTLSFNIGGPSSSVPSGVQEATSPSLDQPQGLAYDSTAGKLYTLVPAYSSNGTGTVDIIIKTNTAGTYDSFINGPAGSWQTTGITFINIAGTDTLFAAYNEWDATTFSDKGKIKKYVSGSWIGITGLSNLSPIGGISSNGTNLYVAYRDQLRIDNRDPATGTQISTFDLSTAWGTGGFGFGPPIWGFDALAYSSGLWAAQGDTIVKFDASTGAKLEEHKTGLWNIQGLTFVSEVWGGTASNILYIATNQYPGQVYKSSLAGTAAPTVENTPIGSYTTQFRVVVASEAPYTAASSFTLGKLSVAPTVTISAPTANFAMGAGSEVVTVSGSINDPSIASVTVGIQLPSVTAFEDTAENATQTAAKWAHASVTGDSPWMMYSSDDLWHRSTERSSDTKPGVGSVGATWRYANSSTGNYVSTEPWKANAGVLRTKNAVSIGDDNTLSFWTWYDGELDFWPDRKVVEVSTNNSTWTTVAWLAKFWPPFKPPDITQAQYNKLTYVTERTWTKVEVSLADYSGQSIYLRFRFDTMDDWNNTFEGWYIDDISVTGAGFQGVSAAVADNLTFSTTFTLAEGANTISVAATRANYVPLLTGTASVSGSLDTLGPAITLNAVTTPTKQAFQIISGTVTEANFDRLELKNNNVLKWSTTNLGTGNTFSQSILLSEGTNSIMVIVTDKVGLSSNVTATISLDSTGPVFDAVFPGSANRTYDVAYKTGEISARPGDSFFIALKVSDAASGVASVKIAVPNEPDSANWPTARRFIKASPSLSQIPEAVIDSWGFGDNTKNQMNYVIPFQIPTGAPSGNYTWTVYAYDNAGNSANTTVITTIVTTLEAFNIYLMPDWNLVSSPLIPTNTSIATLTTSINATGLFELVWYYDASDSADPWKLYQPGAPSDLTTLTAGRGYWFKMKDLAAFTTAGEVSGPMASGLPNTPAPVKLTVEGVVLQPGAVIPPTYSVYAGWNLIGLHSEFSRPVSTALSSVTVPSQIWGSLLQYLNYINFPLTQGATPEIDLGRFDRLISTDTMQPGRGFWLFMVQAGTLVP